MIGTVHAQSRDGSGVCMHKTYARVMCSEGQVCPHVEWLLKLRDVNEIYVD